MIGDTIQFISVEVRNRGKVIQRDNTIRQMVGTNMIDSKNNFFIKNILLVEGLKHNLLSISQLCDKGYSANFFSTSCIISQNGIYILNGIRVNNVYMLDFNCIKSPDTFYLKIIFDESWL
ncbi:hypothetical protein MA16_Dca008633 [Dendrobium catenatum]|uniref:Retrovirus-related Pol polyprotein from transposon TNT 1-94 n=1 Tax=Dendrobium catenatum TaxID=906689 RepID=A0A2I0WA92_9ASPA|nr:hypothetical protein MA16_Dca008633 [Dendrobium catenatum]